VRGDAGYNVTAVGGTVMDLEAKVLIVSEPVHAGVREDRSTGTTGTSVATVPIGATGTTVPAGAVRTMSRSPCNVSAGPPRPGHIHRSRHTERGPLKELLDDIERWQADGHRVALARVVQLIGSGPRGPGATMAVNDAGDVAGSVSGGCVEGAVVSEALEVLASGRPRLCTFGYSDDEAFSVGLTCGGTIRIFVEPMD
jgi:xanthine dehydrogenase accessory factor